MSTWFSSYQIYIVFIPDRALVLDWVFADGPPQKANMYDNNNHLDFHAVVPKSISEELFWVEEEHKIFKKLQEERKLKEEAVLHKVSFNIKYIIDYLLSNTCIKT